MLFINMYYIFAFSVLMILTLLTNLRIYAGTTYPFFDTKRSVVDPFQVGPDLYNDRLVFELSYDLEYQIYIHDPKYFVITSNNAYFPVIKISTNPNNSQSFFFNFDLTEVVEFGCKQFSNLYLCAY